MNKKFLRNIITLAVAVFAGASLSQSAQAAGNATLNLSPASGSVAQNATLNVGIVINPSGESTPGGQVRISFDPAVFDSVTADCADASYTKTPDGAPVTGEFFVACVKTDASALSGTTTIGTIHLHVASGAALGAKTVALEFNADPDSVATTDTAVSNTAGDTNVMNQGGSAGGSYTVTTASSSGGSSSGGTSSGSTGSTSTSGATTGLPKAGQVVGSKAFIPSLLIAAISIAGFVIYRRRLA